MTEYLYFWLAGVVSFLTAVGYAVSVWNGVRLPAGFLWVGFPMRGNRLLRLGLVSFDSNLRSRPKWSFSVDLSISGRTVSIMLPSQFNISANMIWRFWGQGGRDKTVLAL